MPPSWNQENNVSIVYALHSKKWSGIVFEPKYKISAIFFRLKLLDPLGFKKKLKILSDDSRPFSVSEIVFPPYVYTCLVKTPSF